MAETGRHKCTADDPYVKGKHERSLHPDAEFMKTEDLGLSLVGDIDYYHCPNCNTKFSVEVSV